MIYQYAVYTGNAKFLEVTCWLINNKIKIEAHLNRTRFWIPTGPLLTEFLLRWHDVCPPVNEGAEHAVFGL